MTDTTLLEWNPPSDREDEEYFAEDMNAVYFPGEYEIPREHVDDLLQEDGWSEVTEEDGTTPVDEGEEEDQVFTTMEEDEEDYPLVEEGDEE